MNSVNAEEAQENIRQKANGMATGAGTAHNIPIVIFTLKETITTSPYMMVRLKIAKTRSLPALFLIAI